MNAIRKIGALVLESDHGIWFVLALACFAAAGCLDLVRFSILGTADDATRSGQERRCVVRGSQPLAVPVFGPGGRVVGHVVLCEDVHGRAELP